MGGVARQAHYVIPPCRLCDWWREFEQLVGTRAERQHIKY